MFRDVAACWHTGSRSRCDGWEAWAVALLPSRLRYGGPTCYASRGSTTASRSLARRQDPPCTLEDLATRWTLVAVEGSGQVLEDLLPTAEVRPCAIGFGESSVEDLSKRVELLLIAVDNSKRFERVASNASECLSSLSLKCMRVHPTDLPMSNLSHFRSRHMKAVGTQKSTVLDSFSFRVMFKKKLDSNVTWSAIYWSLRRRRLRQVLAN